MVESMGYGAQQVGTPRFVVVTHSPLQDVRPERELGLRFTFVPDPEAAIHSRIADPPSVTPIRLAPRWLGDASRRVFGAPPPKGRHVAMNEDEPWITVDGRRWRATRE